MHTTLKQLKRLTAIAYANLGQSDKRQKRQWSFTNYLLLSFPFLPCQAYYYAKVRQWNQVSLKGGSQVNFQCPRRKPSKFPRTTLFVPWSLGHCSVLSKGGCKMSDEWLDLMIWVFESLKLNVSIKFEYFNFWVFVFIGALAKRAYGPGPGTWKYI